LGEKREVSEGFQREVFGWAEKKRAQKEPFSKPKKRGHLFPPYGKERVYSTLTNHKEWRQRKDQSKGKGYMQKSSIPT